MRRVPHTLVGTVTLIANGTDVINLQTAANIHFIRGILASSTGAFNLQITPTDSNKKLFSAALPHVLVTGQSFAAGATGEYRLDGGAGERYPTPLRVNRSTTIVLEVTDTSGAPNTITIALPGYRLER